MWATFWSFFEVVVWRWYRVVAEGGQQGCRVSLPRQRQQLSDAASTAEGTKILEIRNMEGELIYRSIWVAELPG
jgi:hypothetical protein